MKKEIKVENEKEEKDERGGGGKEKDEEERHGRRLGNKRREIKVRARHWCLPHCPGQVEFVNYSCGASESCILLAPLGKNILYILGLLLRMCESFVVCHPSLS